MSTQILTSNNAQTTLAGSITNIATTANLSPGSGAEFPSPSAGQIFVGTFNDAATGLLFEIVHVTSISVDTITMVRAQEGTTALSWNAGDIFGNFFTSGTFSSLAQTYQLQQQATNYAADTGAANAYVVTLSPALTAYVNGMPVRFKAANANTGASTININGVGAVNLTTVGGGTLASGKIQAGYIVECVYDGTEFQITSIHGINELIGATRNLLGSAAGSSKLASWTADQVVAGNSLSGAVFVGPSLTLSFNGAGTGAGGMDTGSTPTSADLYIYAIYNPATNTWNVLGTTAGSGATVYGGSHLPSGYTASCLIWAGKTDGSGNILAFTQYDREIGIAQATAISSGTATSWASVSISSIVPVCARSVGGLINSLGTPASNPLLEVASNSTGLGTQAIQVNGADAVGIYKDIFCTGQQIYYQIAGAGVTGTVYICSYKI